MSDNLILSSDGYKYSHFNMLPCDKGYVHMYIESRGGEYPETLMFGLQSILKKFMAQRITMNDIDEAEDVVTSYGLPFYREGWEYILENYEGRLPLRIRAVPEGTVVPTGNALVTVENTDINCPWLPSFFETVLLRLWYPITVGTLSYSLRQDLLRFAEATGADPSVVDLQLHDFGSRGATTRESAGVGGLAHLVNFLGTDTMDAILESRKYYNYPNPAVSVPAAEHTTIIAWGRENEAQAYEHIFDTYGKEGGIVSVVSDSYDIYNAVENIWGDQLKEKVENSGARLVVRPDSGDPVEVPLEILKILGNKFGYTLNDKGYKVLPECVRVLQGDGLNREKIHDLLEALVEDGWSSENVVLGMGGGLHQKCERDTLKFAMKASLLEFPDGTTRDLYKDPITDRGKRSKKGRLTLVKLPGGSFHTIDPAQLGKGLEHSYTPELEVMRDVFVDGHLLVDESFDIIRQRSQGN